MRARATVTRALAAAVLVALIGACSGGGDGSPDSAGSSPDSAGNEPSAKLVATADERGSFMTPCEHSHSAADDPIVHSGHAGKSHLHEFFGATATDAGSTTETLLAGETTCRSAADRSAYWAPALLVDGEPVQPTHAVAYYRVPVGADALQVEPPPNGLEMIAGDPDAAEPQDRGVVHWRCGPSGDPSPVPVPCQPGREPVLELTFDPCWDGSNLGSSDHRSHLAALGGDGTCPETHPVLLPELTLEVRYPDDRQRYPEGEVSLASGPITGGHGDALLAWDQDYLAGEVDICLRDNLTCDVVSERSRLDINEP